MDILFLKITHAIFFSLLVLNSKIRLPLDVYWFIDGRLEHRSRHTLFQIDPKRAIHYTWKTDLSVSEEKEIRE